jgi:hypothetical protein
VNLLARLCRLERRTPPPPPGCERCRHWPRTAYVHDWRDDRPAPWLPTLRCPDCGRPAPGVIEFVENWQPTADR